MGAYSGSGSFRRNLERVVLLSESTVYQILHIKIFSESDPIERGNFVPWSFWGVGGGVSGYVGGGGVCFVLQQLGKAFN